MVSKAIKVLFALILALLVIPRVLAFFSVSSGVLGYPYQMDYTEGIVWQQAALMFTPLAYGPIDGFPAIVFEYAPVFHSLTRAVAAVTGWDLLLSGRVVSLLACVSVIVALGLIIQRSTGKSNSSPAAVVVAAVLVLTSTQLTYTVSLMRVDILALSFALFGFLFGVISLRRPNAIFFASLFFLLAVFTKQNTIAAPAAIFSLLAWLRPRTAVIGVLACVAGGVLALALLSAVTEGRFVEHIFSYNLNRIDPDQLRLLLGILFGSNFSIMVAVGIILVHWRRDWAGFRAGAANAFPREAILSNPASSTRIAVVAYLATSTVMLAGIMKSGANDNYAIEWTLVLFAVVGSALLESWRLFLGRPHHLVGAQMSTERQLFVALLIMVPFVVTSIPHLDRQKLAVRRVALDSLVSRVRDSDRPVVSDEMTVILRAGKDVEIEPAIFAELASKGRWSEAAFLRRIANQEFAMFITENSANNVLFKRRYSKAVQAALLSAYPVTQGVAGYTVYLPAQETQP